MSTSREQPTWRGRVLVVDDDPAIRAFLTDFLEQLNFLVRTVPNGAAALDAFHAEPFDIILLDFQMPGMTGPELAAQIRATHPHIPIALMTGTYNILDHDAMTRAGITHTFAKPFNLDELSLWLSSLSH
jgi:CheY-like chemotaxis protein